MGGCVCAAELAEQHTRVHNSCCIKPWTEWMQPHHSCHTFYYYEMAVTIFSTPTAPTHRLVVVVEWRGGSLLHRVHFSSNWYSLSSFLRLFISVSLTIATGNWMWNRRRRRRRWIVHRTNSWGYLKNGTFDGMIGALVRKEIDVGGSPIFFRTERAKVIDYTARTWVSRWVNCEKHTQSTYTLHTQGKKRLELTTQTSVFRLSTAPPLTPSHTTRSRWAILFRKFSRSRFGCANEQTDGSGSGDDDDTIYNSIFSITIFTIIFIWILCLLKRKKFN